MTSQFAIVCLLLSQQVAVAFLPHPQRRSSNMPVLNAKGKGFAKVEKPLPSSSSSPSSSSQQQEYGAPSSSPPAEPFLKSAEGAVSKPVQVDESLPPEERTKQILREKYGLKTMAEQQMDEKQLEIYQAKQKRQAELKRKIELDKDLDIMSMFPPAVLVGLDRFLKGGLVITGTLFILAGIGITFEAYSKVSEKPLPSNIDAFIVNIIEPNFTTGLLVLLGFSVSLGAFAAAQLASESSQYRED